MIVLLEFQRETDLLSGIFQVRVEQVADLIHIACLHGLIDRTVL